MSLEPKVHAIIVTYRRPIELGTMLKALDKQTRRPDTVFVVDNASDPQIDEIVRRDPMANYVSAGDNGGPAGGISLGFACVDEVAADHDWVLFVDDDDLPLTNDVIEHLLITGSALRAELDDLGGVGMAGARFSKRTARLSRVPDRQLVGSVQVDYIGGNQFPIYSVAALRRAGSSRADLFFGFDDLELGLRLRLCGFRLFADGERWLRTRRELGRLRMSARDAARSRERSTWRRYYSTRNLIWIARHHLGFAAAVAATLRYGVAPLIPDVVRTRSLERTGASLRAVRDGWLDRLGRRVQPN